MPREPTVADWIVKTMVAVAGADGRLNAREVELIQTVYESQTGKSAASFWRCRRTRPSTMYSLSSLRPREA